MDSEYSPAQRAYVTSGDDGRLRHILHTPRYHASPELSARAAATGYLLEKADSFDIPPEQLRDLHQRVSFLDPREQDVQYRLHEVKKFFAASTFCFYQTIHNVPVRDAGLTVTLKEGPPRIVHSDHRGHRGVEVKLPPRAALERIREAIAKIPVARGDGVGLAGLLRSAGYRARPPPWVRSARATRGLFYVYRYEADERQPDGPRAGRKAGRERHRLPALPLPAVPRRIRSGRHRLVVEVVFHLTGKSRRSLNWKALVDVGSGAILWLRPMTACVDGRVFRSDPKTGTGNLANTADSSNAVLDPLTELLPLEDLDGPVNGVQSLTGSHVTVIDDDTPTIAPPTKPSGQDFEYSARTNDFAAVSAYHHANEVFDVIEGLGFVLSSYFDGTSFPLHVDHRASQFDESPLGVDIGAFCNGDAPGGADGDGIGFVGFMLSDLTNTAEPLGRAVDRWVHWHELGGHGILWDHVNSGFLGFSHSAGDSMAAFQNDPDSGLRNLPERFRYGPFPTLPPDRERWFNRTVAAGYGWGGTKDDGQTGSEQILATTLFRVYQAIGGDAAELAKRRHASRVASYLVLNAVGMLTPGANADSPLDFYNTLVAADADDWTTEPLAGGAYHKVLRWSFEKQDLWDGAPPEVDLYVDDGRAGEYPYQPHWWDNLSVWNRQSAGATYGHEPAIEGATNYAYVRVRNRGTSSASGVVKLYHCKPGAGLTWPDDFDQIGPADGIPTGSVQANNGNQPTVGPFEWTPNENVYGHDCLLAIVSTASDPSNVENLEPGQTIQEWRLVPHDNNVGQRNVQLAPGGGGAKPLSLSLDGAPFLAGNNLSRPAEMRLRASVPKVLAKKGWKLRFEGAGEGRFRLRPGEKREIRLRVVEGASFEPEELRGGDHAFVVELLANGMTMGGMTYRVDPHLTEARAGH